MRSVVYQHILQATLTPGKMDCPRGGAGLNSAYNRAFISASSRDSGRVCSTLAINRALRSRVYLCDCSPGHIVRANLHFSSFPLFSILCNVSFPVPKCRART